MICHGCGTPGHIRPNCPEKVGEVKSPDRNSQEISIFFIDTGADHTIVRADLVPESKLTGNFMRLSAFGNIKLLAGGITKALLERIIWEN